MNLSSIFKAVLFFISLVISTYSFADKSKFRGNKTIVKKEKLTQTKKMTSVKVTANFAKYLYVVEAGSNLVTVLDTSTPNYNIVANISVGGSPSAIAINNAGNTAYVANSLSQSVSVIDIPSLKVTATIKVGKNPSALVVSLDDATLYVANKNSKTISVISTSNNTLTKTISVGIAPLALAINSVAKTNMLLVANSISNTISIINTLTNQVSATISVGTTPVGVAINPLGDRAYIANQNANTVSVINLITNQIIATIPVGDSPTGVVVNYSGSKIFVSNNNDNTVSVIENNAVIKVIPVGNSPQGLLISPAGNYVYVSNSDDNTVSIIDEALFTVSNQAILGNVPVSLAMANSLVTYAYMADNDSNAIIVVNTVTNTVVGTITTKGPLKYVTANTAGTYVYGIDYNSNLYKISTKTNTVEATINFGPNDDSINELAISPDGKTVLATSAATNSVAIISTVTNTLVRKFSLAKPPTAVAFDSTGAFAYVGTCSGSSSPGEPDEMLVQYDTLTYTAVNTASVYCVYDIRSNPVSSNIYVVITKIQGFSIYNSKNLKFVASLGDGNSPEKIVINSAGDKAYLAMSNGGTVGVFDLNTNSVIATIGSGFISTSLSLTQNDKLLYVTNQEVMHPNFPSQKGNYNSVVIDTKTNAVIKTMLIGSTLMSVTTASVHQ
ncbi:MAG: beta-propeller fold lactonase family protein [Pseudobdellovibrio sp.]